MKGHTEHALAEGITVQDGLKEIFEHDPFNYSRAQNFRFDQGSFAVIIYAVHGNTFLTRSIPAVIMLMDFPFAALMK